MTKFGIGVNIWNKITFFSRVFMRNYYVTALILILVVGIISCNSGGGSSSSSSTSFKCGESGGYCIIFTTNTTLNNAAIDNDTNNGVTGDNDSNPIEEGDAICNADSNKPTSANYKAIIVKVNLRDACVNANCTPADANDGKDWPLLANTQYRRSDETTVIGTTDGNKIFSNILTSSIGTGLAFTGVKADWTSENYSNTCNSYSSNSAAKTSTTANLAQVNVNVFSTATTACSDTTAKLICVEQP